MEENQNMLHRKTRKKWGCIFITLLLCFTPAALAEEESQERSSVTVHVLQDLSSYDALTEDEAKGSPFIPESLEDGKAVIGSDNRIIITNPYQFPYSAIAYIQAEGACGCPWKGTGFMISSRWMMTAGHCMYCVEHHAPVKDVKFYFGYEDERNYLLLQDAGCTIWISQKVEEGTDYHEDDYAFLRFDDPIGDHTGWFGYWYGAPDPVIESEALYCAGYKDGILKSDYDWARVFDSKFITHTIDMVKGNSGCPLFDQDYNVIAINTAEARDGTENYGVRLTEKMQRLIQNAGFPE